MGRVVENNITWIATPKDTITQYKNTNIITPLKDTDITLQAKYKIYYQLQVKWIVNGHELPPMPDEKLNNSTLLGIDINNNGVRDDVERQIYEEYKDKHPIHIDITMQATRGYKKVLMMPEKALEIHDEVLSPIYCEGYYSFKPKNHNNPLLIKKGEDIDSKTKSKYFNTKERYRIYREEYDRRLSGHTFRLPWHSEQKNIVISIHQNMIRNKKMKKIIIFLSLFLTFLNAEPIKECVTDIYFANGINITEKDADDPKDKMQDQFQLKYLE